MPKIRVLQISHSFAPPFGDVANFYSNAFDSEKYDVTSLFLKGNPNEPFSEKIKGNSILLWDLKTSELRGLKLGLIRRICNLINDEKYDIVIAQRYKAIYLVGMASFKTHKFNFIGVIHAYNVFKSFSRKLLIKCLSKKITLIGVSKAIQENVSQQLSIINYRDVHALANCIPIKGLQDSMLSREEARKQLDIPESVYVLGTAGRLHPEKNHETLIEAFAKFSQKYPSARLYIMGEGRLKEDLQERIVSLNLSNKAFLLGMIQEGPRYFKAFDIFVLPSKLEPFGMVLIEAMAAGIPVISSKSGGALEVISDSRYLFEIGDIEGCASLLEKHYKLNQAGIDSIIERQNRKIKEKYSEGSFSSKLMEILG